MKVKDLLLINRNKDIDITVSYMRSCGGVKYINYSSIEEIPGNVLNADIKGWIICDSIVAIAINAKSNDNKTLVPYSVVISGKE